MASILSMIWPIMLFCTSFPLASADYLSQFILSDNNHVSTIGNIISKTQPPFPQGPYEIISKKNTYSKFHQYFRILDSGDLLLKRPLDRDDFNNVCGPLLCCDKPKCQIISHLKVTLQRSRQPFNVKLIIDIEDENDNAPTFNSASFSVSILENEREHNRYRLPQAIDLDSPLYQIKDYTLSGKCGDSFSLKVENKEPFLVPTKVFDYEDEAQRRFDCQLTAEDHGGKTGLLNLNVNILDKNDNSPKCLESSANVSVTENTTYTQPIHIFQAKDLDSGPNGQIIYTMSQTSIPIIKDIFRLDNDTGNLYLTRKVDFELYSEKSFHLAIQVSDNGVPPLTDYCSLDVYVTDTNDNPPVIEIAQVQAIPENTVVKDPVMKLYVRDEDNTDNDVTCRTDNLSSGLRLKQVEKLSYLIYATGTYDYEQTNNLSMVLVCQDSGQVPLRTEQLLTIPIKDKNDNTPRFPKPNYDVSLTEDYPLQKSFITVTATDADGDEFGSIKYELGFESRNQFSIDKESGAVALVKELDREAKDVFNISVFAIDGGNLKGYTYIDLRVTDINDNAPVLDRGLLMNVTENVKVGTIVGYFLVKDVDLDFNGHTEWKVDLIDNSTFLLAVDNCTVTTTGVIDREMQDFLYVHVIMSDKGFPSLTATATITVSIIDLNDNIPQVVYPRPGSVIDEAESMAVPTNAPRLSHVLTIRSHDPDSGVNGRVLYHMLPTNGSKYFTINQTDGQVLTNWAYDSISFTPTHPKEGIYEISFSIYNQVPSSFDVSTQTMSSFFVRVVPYRHFVSNEVFQQQHRRPFFNNVVLLILIGGFTISLSAALIAAIVWAKSKYSSESNNLEQVQSNDGKFMMMMMSGEQPHSNNTYVYDPYSSLMMDHDRNGDSGYPINHSRSSTFNTRRTGREHAPWNHYENKTVPRNTVQPDVGRCGGSDVCNNSYSLSTTDLASGGAGGSTIGRQPKLTNSFYRHFEHDSRCHSPILQSLNRSQGPENQYGSISPMRASICDPTPNIATTSNWVPRVPASGEDTDNGYTMC